MHCTTHPCPSFLFFLAANHIVYIARQYGVISVSYCVCFLLCLFVVLAVQPIGVEALTQSVCDLALGFGEGELFVLLLVDALS